MSGQKDYPRDDVVGCNVSVEQWSTSTKELLSIEKDAEAAEIARVQEGASVQELEQRGVALRRLRLHDIKTGLHGRAILRFEPNKAHNYVDTAGKKSTESIPPRLAATKIRAGDIVSLNTTIGSTLTTIATGIVLRLQPHNITVAFEEPPDLLGKERDKNSGGGSVFVLVKSANDVTNRRLGRTLENLVAMVTKRGAGRMADRVVDVLFGRISPPTQAPVRDCTLVNTGLNASQERAVRTCLGPGPVSIIHGPPGTGKTTTLIELITQYVRRGNKVLAAAPSNIAVDNLAERLAAAKISVVRVGHPARMLASAQAVSLDHLVYASDSAQLARDVRDDMTKITEQLRDRKKRIDNAARRHLKDEYRALRKELRQREKEATRRVLAGVSVVVGTLSTLAPDGPLGVLESDHFDVAVVDEAGQALEVACWTVLLQAPRCVLAGDHLQLPPTVTSPEAASRGLGRSLLERAVAVLSAGGDDAGSSTGVCLLDTQYRMHDAIMRWSSDFVYDARLLAGAAVAQRLLCQLPGVTTDENTSAPLVFVDTAGCGLEETSPSTTPGTTAAPSDTDVESKANRGEAEIVARHAHALVGAGLDPAEIGIITPYNGQVEALRTLLAGDFPRMEIKSVDGFQGREKEAILLSLVRSNARRTVGFLRDHRRLNVAVTRAKRHLFVCADSVTVSSDARLATLMEYLGDAADVRTGYDFVNELSVDGNQSMVEAQRKSTKQAAKPRPPPTEAENQQRRDRLTTQIRAFVDDAALQTLEFPAELNAYERRLVHEIAATFANLSHVSSGDGDTRHIRVTKKASPSGTETRSDTSTASDTPLISTDTGARGEDAAKNSPGERSAPIENSSGECVASAAKNTAVGHGSDDLQNPSGETFSRGDDGDGGDVAVGATTGCKSAAAAEPSRGTSDCSPPPEDDSRRRVLVPQGDGTADGMLCKWCSKTVPAPNHDIHVVRCEREQRRRQRERAATAAVAVSQGTAVAPLSSGGGATKKKKGKGKGKGSGGARGCGPSGGTLGATGVTASDGTDTDVKVMEAFARDAKLCQQPSCKASVTLIGDVCSFCKRKFCYTHAQAEVHGCGHAAQVAARRESFQHGARNEHALIVTKRRDQLRRPDVHDPKRAQLARKLQAATQKKVDARSKKKKKDDDSAKTPGGKPGGSRR
eukprot:m.1547909 g.1547909  ORF g.1547909 m.1547909 type:complete len:1164 (+) comp25262_c1_seq4:305-3796(+)